jgi:hypothetical protein
MVIISKSNRKRLGVTILVLFIFFLNISICFAADNLNKAFGTGSKLNQAAGSAGAGYNTASTVTVDSMISLVITTALSFIGVIFLVLAIYGGFIWMMARGNEQEVEKAKAIIQNSLIGLVVVLAAYAISYYVISKLGGTTLK